MYQQLFNNFDAVLRLFKWSLRSARTFWWQLISHALYFPCLRSHKTNSVTVMGIKHIVKLVKVNSNIIIIRCMFWVEYLINVFIRYSSILSLGPALPVALQSNYYLHFFGTVAIGYCQKYQRWWNLFLASSYRFNPRGCLLLILLCFFSSTFSLM